MRRLVLLAPLLIAAAPPQDNADIGKGCISNRPQPAAGNGPTSLHRLDTLPPANLILAVVRSVDGCQKPVITRYGIGGNPAALGG
ncbi:hypothetical protein [Sphingomonas abietis]|uniref:Uncharacterized protein n=1 Tax=Sphingomonas abietis TaxID=3012344 RepID=A0ABY7NN08_9SPHN|nr:hypothetical protein [Sphingomonas abietis]WBO21871.1 hypothetical protein PBT88_17145 [Sphingomonas abietis]